jgi:hypothetical protein
MDESYLEYLLADAIMWDLMDVYDKLPPGHFHDTVTWANEALDHHGNLVEAEFDPELWVM